MKTTNNQTVKAEASSVGRMSEALIETVVKGIMENFPEASAGSALRCVEWHYDAWLFNFDDEETDITYKLDKSKLLAAFPLMLTDKWPHGCTPLPSPYNTDPEVWDNWLCQSDAIDFDAFAQLACLGEVIYG